MKLRTLLLAPLAVVLCAVSGAQSPLTRVDRPDSRAPERFDDEHFAAELRAPELARRRAAYEAVLDWAATNDAARGTVRGWANDSGDVELAWTAELLLRELESRERVRSFPFSRGLLPRRGPGNDDRTGSLFDRLRRSFEPPFDLDVPFGTDDFFGSDLDDLLDEFRSNSSGSSSSQGTSVQIGPDGVRVEVRSSENGDEQVQTYEAESLEALLELHPELKDKIGTRLVPDPFAGRAPRFRTDPDRLLDPRNEPRIDPNESPLQRKPGRMRTDVLGVRVRGPETRSRSLEGVPDDVGLEIVQVLPRTIADELGLAVGETIVAIDGHDVRAVDDVKRALEARANNAPIRVDVVAPDGSRRTRTWQPSRAKTRAL